MSCRWIRSRNRSQLLWVVGNRDKFNEEGLVPVNTTRKNILHNEWKGGWPYLSLLKAVVAVAALFHDWGKSSDHFQKKLRLSSLEKDPYRHEWVSCQLLAAVADISGDTQDDDAWMHLFLEGMLKKTTLKNEMKKHSDQADALPKMPPIMCFSFSKGFLLDDDDWNKAVKKWMARLLREKAQLQQLCTNSSLALRTLLLYAREALMLADHFVSSCVITAVRFCCSAMSRKRISIMFCAVSKRRESESFFKITFFVLIWIGVKSSGVS